MSATSNVNTAGNATQPHRQLPDSKTLEEAGELMIKDKDGNQIPFHSLYTNKPAGQRQLIIFVRHFFCGVSTRPYPFS